MAREGLSEKVIILLCPEGYQRTRHMKQGRAFQTGRPSKCLITGDILAD